MPAGQFWKLSQKQKWGWKLQDGSYISILLFADNYWLIARSAEQLRAMTVEWLRLLRELGWDTPTSELTWATTLTKERFSEEIIIEGAVINQADREEGFKALGTKITLNGRNGWELKARIARAWAAFAKYADILCNQEVSLQKRIKMLTILIHGSLFWCSGSWNLTNDQLDNLKGLQAKMLRRMIGRKRHKTMTLEDYMIATNRIIKDLKRIHDIQDWDIVALKHHFGWAGHVSRLGKSDPERITFKIMCFRDKGWLDLIGSQNHGRQLHCRPLRIWRWERPMAKYAHFSNDSCTDNWHDLASDKRFWLATLDSMALWFRTNRS